MLPFDFPRYSHTFVTDGLLVSVCVSVGQRALNGSPYMMMLHNRGFFSPLHTSPMAQPLTTPQPHSLQRDFGNGTNGKDALSSSRKPAKSPRMNAIGKNLFTVMCSYSWKDGAAISSRPSCKCKGASQNAFQTQK